MYYPIAPACAPQVCSPSDFEALYGLWRGSRYGSVREFVAFMLSPSAARDAFVVSAGRSVKAVAGAVLDLVGHE